MPIRQWNDSDMRNGSFPSRDITTSNGVTRELKSSACDMVVGNVTEITTTAVRPNMWPVTFATKGWPQESAINEWHYSCESSQRSGMQLSIFLISGFRPRDSIRHWFVEWWFNLDLWDARGTGIRFRR